MSESFEVFSLDEEISFNESSRFKARDGETYRVSLAWYPMGDNGILKMSKKAPQFMKANRHYVEGSGYIISNGAEWDKLCMAQGSKGPKLCFATVMVVWPTDRSGQIQKENLTSDWKVQTLILDRNKFKQLRGIHQEWNLSEVDISIYCPEGGAQYQKLQFMNKKDNMLSLVLNSEKAEDAAKKISASVEAASAKVRADIGRDMSLSDLKANFGLVDDDFVSSSSATEMENLLGDVVG